MAVFVECNYQKRLGLPNYSSHAYSVTVRTEVSDLNQVESASAQLFRELQDAVDRDIKNSGWLPSEAESNERSNGNGHHNDWNCSSKQKSLVLDLVSKNDLDKQQIDDLSHDRFGKGIKALNKLEMSGLLGELLESHGKQRNGNGRRTGRGAYGGNRR